MITLSCAKQLNYFVNKSGLKEKSTKKNYNKSLNNFNQYNSENKSKNLRFKGGNFSKWAYGLKAHLNDIELKLEKHSLKNGLKDKYIDMINGRYGLKSRNAISQDKAEALVIKIGTTCEEQTKEKLTKQVILPLLEDKNPRGINILTQIAKADKNYAKKLLQTYLNKDYAKENISLLDPLLKEDSLRAIPDLAENAIRTLGEIGANHREEVKKYYTNSNLEELSPFLQQEHISASPDLTRKPKCHLEKTRPPVEEFFKPKYSEEEYNKRIKKAQQAIKNIDASHPECIAKQSYEKLESTLQRLHNIPDDSVRTKLKQTVSDNLIKIVEHHPMLPEELLTRNRDMLIKPMLESKNPKEVVKAISAFTKIARVNKNYAKKNLKLLAPFLQQDSLTAHPALAEVAIKALGYIGAAHSNLGVDCAVKLTPVINRGNNKRLYPKLTLNAANALYKISEENRGLGIYRRYPVRTAIDTFGEIGANCPEHASYCIKKLITFTKYDDNKSNFPKLVVDAANLADKISKKNNSLNIEKNVITTIIDIGKTYPQHAESSIDKLTNFIESEDNIKISPGLVVDAANVVYKAAVKSTSTTVKEKVKNNSSIRNAVIEISKQAKETNPKAAKDADDLLKEMDKIMDALMPAPAPQAAKVKNEHSAYSNNIYGYSKLTTENICTVNK